uniref:Uncharacterized protein n=1 Tax=Manihot esculenta TaxID=3983 RepID=A0A2C9U045_MANES
MHIHNNCHFLYICSHVDAIIAWPSKSESKHSCLFIFYHLPLEI